MKIQVKILDDDGEVLAEHEADACQPSMWRAPSTRKLLGKMPQISDRPDTGTYELFGISFQPHVRVARPNGWTEPSPQPSSPVNGQSLNTQNKFPNSAPSFPNMGIGGLAKLNKSTLGRTPGLRG